ncbi:MAG TPA: hypothetical protein VI636_25450 [Candidatus Angelobacter sp.]
MKRIWFLLTVLVGSAIAQNPPVDLDHFWCYFIPNQPTLNIPILLQDQFDAAMPPPQNWEHINQLTLARICNTVDKIVTSSGKDFPMINPSHHLTMYQINPQPVIPRVVTAIDQFTTQILDVSDARFLLVPTGKVILPGSAPSPSPDLDHYKCYAACGSRVNVPVILHDQFTLEGVTVLWPVLFCNPVVKVRSGPNGSVTTPIQKPNDHLTCYSNTPSIFPGLPDPTNPNSPRGINISNQFEVGNKTVLKPDLLCVPSTKLQWAPVPAATPTTTTASQTPKK